MMIKSNDGGCKGEVQVRDTSPPLPCSGQLQWRGGGTHSTAKVGVRPTYRTHTHTKSGCKNISF